METPFYDIVRETLGADAFHGKTVLDVGCARFGESKVMQEQGAKLVALDVCHREDHPEGIRFVHSNFLEWIPDVDVDVAYLSQSALFMPTEEVFSKIASLDASIIAVRTMYGYPEPNWPPEVLKPLWFTTPEDWEGEFEPRGYETRLARSYEIDTPDMGGTMRKFFFTEYIGVRM